MILSREHTYKYVPWMRILGIICFFLLSVFSLNAKKYDDYFIQGEINKRQPYEGETFVLSYFLYSKSPDIAFVNRIGEIKAEGDEASFFSRIESDRRGQKTELNGEIYYRFPLEHYIVSFDHSGKFKYLSGEFEIGIKTPVVYDDPFWGRRRGYKTEEIVLSPKEVELKVRSLPGKSQDPKANSIGRYAVEVKIPRGDIFIDRPARALIILKGEGMIGDDVLPDYVKAFKGGDVKLKSMSESRKQYFDGKDLISELILDCEFIPESKKVEIGEVSFSFFNPITGKYEVATSSPVEIEVKSIVSKMETVDI